MALRGGGDWHMDYILIYRKLETFDNSKMEVD